jgi:hypothetical protein
MTRTSFDSIAQAREACAELGASSRRGAFIDRVGLLCDGERLRKDRFPVLWSRADNQGR